MKVVKNMALILSILMFFVLVGCDEKVDSKIENRDGDASTIVVKHKLGETNITIPPKRVVVFDFGILDTLRAMKAPVKGLPKQLIPKYLSSYEADSYLNVGGLKEPNFEAISRVAPDLIIISDRQAELYDEFSKIAPTLLMDVDDQQFVASVKANIVLLGKIFQKEAESSRLVSQIDLQLEQFKQAQQKTDPGATSKKALVMIASDNDMSAFGKGSRFGLIFDELGFMPSDPNLNQSTHGQKITYEYIIEQNPDLIFVLDRGATIGSKKTAEEIMSNPLLKNVKAVSQNKIIYLNGDAWYLSAGGFEAFQTMLNDAKHALTQSDK